MKIILYNTFTQNWQRFDNPVEVIEARELHEVIPAMEKIEQKSTEGYYAAGFVCYEAAPAFDDALMVKHNNGFPLLRFGIYKTTQDADPYDYAKKQFATGEWLPSVTQKEYRQNIARIKEYIRNGYTYQVNYTYRLNTRFSGDSYSFFLSLLEKQVTGYAAYIECEEITVCSVSPELFFTLNGDKIFSKPMKGTAARGRCTAEDREIASGLSRSEKDRAENIMITDMIRNDIGKIADKGSVTASPLCEIEKYDTAFQMTSTVRGKTGASLPEIFKALFPCASITGAPKVETMKIISGLETSPRNLYTGTIGFIAPGRKAQFNVAIRTATINNLQGTAGYGTGGGIVWDSETGSEYNETLTKIKVLTEKNEPFDLLETMLWEKEKGIWLFEYHLDRIEDSAAYFGYSCKRRNIINRLKKLITGLSGTKYKIRLLLDKKGNVKTELGTLGEEMELKPVKLKFSAIRIDPGNRMLYHKTTNRKIYTVALAGKGRCDDVILLNKQGEVTETTIYNIIAEINGKLYTPPVGCGLLPGTYRQYLLEKGDIGERILYPGDILNADNIYLINSVRGKRKAEIIS